MTIEVLIGLIGAGTALLLGLLQWRSQTSVHSADATEKIGNAYDSLLDRLSLQVKELDTRVKFLEVELKKYSNWSSKLVMQLVEHGIQPLPMETPVANTKEPK